MPSPYTLTTNPSRMSLSEDAKIYRKRTTCGLQVRILTCIEALQKVLTGTKADLPTLLWKLADGTKELELFTGLTPTDVKSLRWKLSGKNEYGLGVASKDYESATTINELIKLSLETSMGSSTPALVAVATFLRDAYDQELALFEKARGEIYDTPPCLRALQTAAAEQRPHASLAPLVAALANVHENLSAETADYPTTEEMPRDEWWYGYGLDDYCQPGETPDPSRGIGYFRGVAPWDMPCTYTGAAYVKALKGIPIDEWTTTFELPPELAAEVAANIAKASASASAKTAKGASRRCY